MAALPVVTYSRESAQPELTPFCNLQRQGLRKQSAQWAVPNQNRQLLLDHINTYSNTRYPHLVQRPISTVGQHWFAQVLCIRGWLSCRPETANQIRIYVFVAILDLVSRYDLMKFIKF